MHPTNNQVTDDGMVPNWHQAIILTDDNLYLNTAVD